MKNAGSRVAEVIKKDFANMAGTKKSITRKARCRYNCMWWWK